MMERRNREDETPTSHRTTAGNSSSNRSGQNSSESPSPYAEKLTNILHVNLPAIIPSFLSRSSLKNTADNMSGIFDLEKNFVFYASYHHSTMNKLIHILCVWPILWTFFVFAEYAPWELSSAPAFLIAYHPFNLTYVFVLIYSIFYILFDQKAGTAAAFLLFLCLVTARKFYLTAEVNYGYPAWLIAAGIHVAGWLAQFFGHGHYEGRAPALLDNLLQAFLMAPFFVFLEVLFFFGYRKDFQVKVEKQVLKNIAQFKQEQANSKGKGKKK